MTSGEWLREKQHDQFKHMVWVGKEVSIRDVERWLEEAISVIGYAAQSLEFHPEDAAKVARYLRSESERFKR